MVVRSKERARLVGDAQMFGRRPGDGQAVEGGSAAADFIEDDETSLCRLIEDGGGFYHLHHEGRAAAREIIGGADTREQPVNDPDMCRFRRYKTSHLRENRDKGILA